MTLQKPLALIAAVAGLVALVALSASPGGSAHAQTGPATFYGTVAAGETVEAFIDGVSCGSTVAGADGFWQMQVPVEAPCAPADGATVTFERDGKAMLATETWSPLGTPANVATGVPGELAPSTPTDDGAAVVDETLDLVADKALVDGKEVVQVSAADASVTAIIPVAAVQDTATIDVTIETVAEADLTDDIPSGTFLINGQAINVNISNDAGEAITEFAEELTFTVQAGPDVDPETVSVSFFDTALTPPQWVQLPSDDFSVAADGTVTFVTDHLTLFSILRLPKVTFVLAGGLNSITYTGPSGTSASTIASEIGASLQTLLVFDAPTQMWQTFLPGAPAIVNTLQTLNQRDALILRVGAGPLEWTETDIIPEPGGTRTVTLIPGLNPIGFTGQNNANVADLLASVAQAVESAARFDATSQTWQTFLPGAPPIVNTLNTLNRLDVVYIRVKGATQQPLSLPDVASD